MTQNRLSAFWSKLPVACRAIISGLLIALVAANIWPVLLLKLGVPLAAVAELIFLSLYIWWAAGGGPPRLTQSSRANSFRRIRLSAEQCLWGVIGAISFAVTVHAAIVLLFRFVPFPAAAFRRGYDLSFIPSLQLKWVAVVISAISAAICEETGFRGYMQRPIEQRHGVAVAIFISSNFFSLVHLNKSWVLIGMIPIVFGAGILLGLLVWSSGSLIPGIIGHAIMDIGLFAYWWTGIAGEFTARPISQTGIDFVFVVACVILVVALLLVMVAISELRSSNSRMDPGAGGLTRR